MARQKRQLTHSLALPRDAVRKRSLRNQRKWNTAEIYYVRKQDKRASEDGIFISTLSEIQILEAPAEDPDPESARGGSRSAHGWLSFDRERSRTSRETPAPFSGSCTMPENVEVS